MRAVTALASFRFALATPPCCSRLCSKLTALASALASLFFALASGRGVGGWAFCKGSISVAKRRSKNPSYIYRARACSRFSGFLLSLPCSSALPSRIECSHSPARSSLARGRSSTLRTGTEQATVPTKHVRGGSDAATSKLNYRRVTSISLSGHRTHLRASEHRAITELDLSERAGAGLRLLRFELPTGACLARECPLNGVAA